MGKQEFVARIGGLIHETLHIAVPSPDTDLFESGLLDSLALVTLLVGLEEDFICEFPLDRLDLEHFRSVERIADFVASFGGFEGGAMRPIDHSGASA